ncbi:MAG: prepilin peptidase [Candidatus Diapherotrites archaeon]|nr:prepilin peptidase [Candidatus Diapherotrites archaeon]
MWPLLFFLISVSALAHATYTDLKDRTVSDRLTYTLIFGGLALQFIRALTANDMGIIFTAAALTLATFAGAWMLWKLGVWAGGDVKLFTGIAALNPFNESIIQHVTGIHQLLLQPITLPIFPLTLFLFSVFCMLPAGTAIALPTLLKNKSLRSELRTELIRRTSQIIQLMSALIGLGILLEKMQLNGWLVLPLLLLLGIVPSIPRKTTVGALALIGMWFLETGWMIRLLEGTIPLLLLYLLIWFFTRARTQAFTSTKKITELTEGEITGETIAEQEGVMTRIPFPSGRSIINDLKAKRMDALMNWMNPAGRLLAASRSAAGSTAEQLQQLKTATESGRIKNHILIKKSAPFVPAILLAYLLLQALGDPLWNLIL